MSLGDFPLGQVPLGLDNAPIEVEDKPKLPRAMLFDPMRRDFPLDDKGRYQDHHPVDAAVELALVLEFKKVGATLGAGQTFREIRSPSGPTVPREVDDRVRRALKHLTERRLIHIEHIAFEVPNRHALFLAITYRNLQTAARDTKRVAV